MLSNIGTSIIAPSPVLNRCASPVAIGEREMQADDLVGDDRRAGSAARRTHRR